MARQKKKWPWPFAEVIWMDANSKADWHPSEKHPSVVEVYQRGWLIRDDDDQLVMAAQVIEEEDKMEDPYSIGDVCAIPRGCIKSIRKLKI